MDNIDIGNKRSPVWMFFGVTDNDISKAVCNLCRATISRGNGRSKNFSTTPLNNHLKYKHPDEYKTIMEFRRPLFVQTSPIKSESRTSTFEIPVTCNLNRKQWYIDSPEAQRLHEAIGEMIAIDVHPYTIVDDIGFRNVLAVAEPKYNIPSCRYFAEIVIPTLYERIKANVQVNINEASRLSFTTATWTVDATLDEKESLLGITAHWINDDFQHQYAVLHCQYFSDPSVDVTLADTFFEVLSQWNVEKSRIQVVLQDHEANIAESLRNSDIQGVDCFDHSLQLCINNSVLIQPSIASLIDSSRELVELLKPASSAASRLNSIQLELELPPRYLLSDVINEWNSTLYMLEQLLEQKKPITRLVSEVENIKGLTSEQWAFMKDVISLLKPFEQLACEVNKSSSLSVVLPAVKSLLLYLNNLSDMKTQEIMSDTIKSVNRCFSHLFEDSVLIVAMAVDPRFKLQTITNGLKQRDARMKLFSAVHGLVVERSSTSLPASIKQEPPDADDKAIDFPPTKVVKTKSSSEFDFWAAWDSANLHAQSDGKISMSPEIIESEISKFLAVPCLPRTEDPLLWWRQNEHAYPNLCLCAKVFLAIPSTRFSIENLFSTERKNCHMQENFEQLVFLKANLLNFQ